MGWRTRRHLIRVSLSLCAALMAACTYTSAFEDVTCDTSADCPDGAACVSGYCAFPSGTTNNGTNNTNNVNNEVPVIDRVEVSPAQATIKIGEDTLFEARALTSDGAEVPNVAFTWSVGDATVATMVDGTATGLKVGSTTVQASADGKSGSANLEVETNIESITIEPGSANLGLGTSTMLVATVLDADGNALDVPVNWSSSDTSVARVDSDGLVSGVELGEATITAERDGVSADAAITVVDVAPASLDLEPESARIRVDDTLTLRAIVRDADGNEIRGRAISWSYTPVLGGLSVRPGEPDVVDFSPQNPGTTVITAQLGELTDSSSVEIYVPAIKSVVITPDMPMMSVDEVIALSVQVLDEDDVVVMNPTINWFTSDSSVAEVDANSGNLVGKGKGTATITAEVGGVMGTASATVRYLLSAISAGEKHTCGLTPTGSAWCWGEDGDGQLGNGGTTDEDFPVRATTSELFAEIHAAKNHTCARSGGNVYCWGSSANGRLGIDPAPSEPKVPNLVNQTLQFIQVSTSSTHTCAVDDQAEIYCWGQNANGKLAIAGGDVLVPTKISDPAGQLNKTWKAVSAGGEHTCAIDMSDQLWCWGLNDDGQLGDGSRMQKSAPVAVDTSNIGSPNFIALTTGAAHTCAITSGNDAYCWGSNGSGRLGTASMGPDATRPTAVDGGIKFASISAGTAHTCGVLMTIGEVNCWGEVDRGRLGTTDTSDINSPAPIQVNLNASMVSSGHEHTCAVTNSYEPYCWGRDDRGQLGTGGSDTSMPSVVWP